MRHSSIIGAEELSPQALQAVGVSTDPSTGADNILNGGVTSSGTLPGVQQPCNLFFGTQMCYLFIRLHHIIFSRLTTARQLAFTESQNVWKAHPLSRLDAPEDGDDEVGVASSYTHAQSANMYLYMYA
jgi:hypothetical protein